MKTIFTFLIITISVNVFGNNWILFGPAGIHANNILFGAGSNGYTLICTDNGVCVNNGAGYSWNTYLYSLPVWEAVPYDTDNVLLVMGNGSFSDGIYKFNLTTNTFNVVEACYIPTFIKYCALNNTYYAGTRYNGLLSSTDGVQWDTVPYFQNKGCAAMDFYGQHMVVTQENNIYATYYSDDGGNTWNQSTSNIPIHDLAFNMNGLLYGVFTGFSNSSGLYLSHDFGHTWNMEYFIDNMNTVGFDIFNKVFTGFHGAIAPDEGVAIYDTTTNNFTFLNTGLPNKNINKFKIYPLMNSFAIFACTDTGVYFCNDYLTSLQNKNDNSAEFCIYPNPAGKQIKIESEQNSNIEIINTEGRIIQTFMMPDTMIYVDISSFYEGVYFIKAKTKNKIIVKKIIKL